ncbi:MAG: allantoate amidohydrolase [Pseudomonadota bacterium]|nr:allantoate amidohydrolase [Pseudomonadota bacterium]
MMTRLDDFAAFTDEPGRLTRLYLSASYRRACEQFAAWARAAGMSAAIDAVGNVRARYEGRAAHAPALMIGSHIDTVRDAGRFDGNLGALAALGVVEQLHEQGVRLDHAIEVVAFGDEEGVRFSAAMTGSRALSGRLGAEAMAAKDKQGVTLAEALRAFGSDPEGAYACRAQNVAAFVELHIEQGPVLEARGLALGVVSAINGATRRLATVRGHAGHAGTVPMDMRRDAATAAAEMILAVEARARAEADLVATVGRLEAEPGAINVIPGLARFSLDVRAPRDEQRRRAVDDIQAACAAIAQRRHVEASFAPMHEAPAYVCDAGVVAGFDRALAALGQPTFHLPSGAGHDTMVMGGVVPSGMLFVRCKGGISHNPAESITPEDGALALAALTRFAVEFRA